MPAFASVFHYAAAVISPAAIRLSRRQFSCQPLRRHMPLAIYFLTFSFFDAITPLKSFRFQPRHFIFFFFADIFRLMIAFSLSFSPL
jgi:hypothetical protein